MQQALLTEGMQAMWYALCYERSMQALCSVNQASSTADKLQGEVGAGICGIVSD